MDHGKLKAYIDADPALSACRKNSDGADEIAKCLNAATDFVVWRTSVSVADIVPDDWAAVEALTAGQARIWDWLTRSGAINPSIQSVRAGIDAAFGGTPLQTQIYAACKRQATLAERVLATGDGKPDSPGVMGFEGRVSYSQIEEARTWQQ